jgi:bifunctional non-homologous end joining protein LigD
VRPPTGDGWIHEVKFDGYRIQAHVANDDVTLYSKNGHHFTDRFPTIAYALRDLPAKAAVIDAELVPLRLVLGPALLQAIRLNSFSS